MFHQFTGKLKEHGDEVYIENDLCGIQVQYSGSRKKWSWYVYPVIDPNRHTIKYYAFDIHKQKVRFVEICKIQWIWGKNGYLLACRDEKELEKAIEAFDVKYFTAMKGIWPKTAKRILLELKSTISKKDVKKLSISDSLLKNIVQWLSDLGYERQHIKQQLFDCPIDLKKDNLPEIMKRLVDHL